jgi:hypothetical protein
VSGGEFLAAIIVLWVYVALLFLLLLRACSYMVQLSDQVDLARLRVGMRDETGVRVGDIAPDFVVETLTRKRVLLSSIWGRDGAVLLFVSSGCEHCELLLVDLWHTGIDTADQFLVVSGDSRERAEKWLSMIVSSDPALLARVVTSTELSARLMFAYNPRGTFPWYVVIDIDGVVREAGPAVKRNVAWTERVATLHRSEARL